MLGIRRYHCRPGRQHPALGERAAPFPENMLENTEEYLKDCERIIQLYHDPIPTPCPKSSWPPASPSTAIPKPARETVKLALCQRRADAHAPGRGRERDHAGAVGESARWTGVNIGLYRRVTWYAHGWELTPEV